MEQDHGQDGFGRDEGLPEGLREDLGSLYGTGDGADVPRRVDEAVMAAARARFGGSDFAAPRAGLSVVVRRIGLVGGPLAAAAAVALVVWLVPIGPGGRGPAGPGVLPGTGGKHAQRVFERRLGQEMAEDHLAFLEAEDEERMRELVDARGGAGEPSSALAVMADAGRADADELVESNEVAMKAGRRGASAPVASEARVQDRPRWAEDFNADGAVDMLDALTLARTLERGAWSVGMEWDLNGDGVVDTGDVGVVALAAVDLERHGEVVR